MEKNKFIIALSAALFVIIALVATVAVIQYINYNKWIKEQQKITPVPGKIFFTSIGRDEPNHFFILENGKITTVRTTRKGSIIQKEKATFIQNYQPFDFDISPDSHTIAFSSRMGGNISNIYTIDIEGKNLKQLTDFKVKPFWSAGYPKFSPDGKKIAFEGPKYLDRGDSPATVYLINSDGTDMKELFGDKLAGGVEASWSSDGKKLAFISTIDKYRNIFLVDLSTLEVKQITNYNENNYGHVYHPCFSPDGRIIAFMLKTRGVTAGSEIFAINVDGTNQIRLTPAKRYNRYPYWATDDYPDWAE